MQSYKKVNISHTAQNVYSGVAASNCHVQIRIHDITRVNLIVSLIVSVQQIGKV